MGRSAGLAAAVLVDDQLEPRVRLPSDILRCISACIEIALLVGLVNLVAMGPTNAIKPPLIRFAASLVNVVGRDRDIFRIGLFWGVVQIVVTTIFLLFLVPVWK